MKFILVKLGNNSQECWKNSRDYFETTKNGYDFLNNTFLGEFETNMEYIYYKFIDTYLLEEHEKYGI